MTRMAAAGVVDSDLWVSCSERTAGDGWIAANTPQDLGTFEESCYFFANYSRDVDRWDRAWHTCATATRDSTSLLAVIESSAELQWVLKVMRQKQIARVWVDATVARYRSSRDKSVEPVAAWRGGTALNSSGVFNASQIDTRMKYIDYNDTSCNFPQKGKLWQQYYSALFLESSGAIRVEKEYPDERNVGFLCKKHRTAPTAYRDGFNLAHCFWNPQVMNIRCPENWREYSGSCYTRDQKSNVYRTKSADEHFGLCHQIGADLIYFESEADNSFSVGERNFLVQSNLFPKSSTQVIFVNAHRHRYGRNQSRFHSSNGKPYQWTPLYELCGSESCPAICLNNVQVGLAKCSLTYDPDLLKPDLVVCKRPKCGNFCFVISYNLLLLLNHDATVDDINSKST